MVLQFRQWPLVVVLCCSGCGASDDNEQDSQTRSKHDSGVMLDAAAAETLSMDIRSPESTTADTACAKTQAAAVKRPVDIIVSIDGSGSMTDDAANVQTNINHLAEFLAKTGLDYRVVMIGASTAICVPPPLGAAGCASNPPRFRAVNQSVSSHNTLNVLLTTYGMWSDMLRPEAIKAFVPVTDDNASTAGSGSHGKDAGAQSSSSSSFDAQLLALGSELFGSAEHRKYVFYPICGAPAYPGESPKCGDNAVNTGSEYLALAKLTGGKWFPICLTNFGPVFEEMAKKINTQISCELTIPPPPDGKQLDPNQLNVVYSSSGGTSASILQDANKPCDAGANGWQYSADKTSVLLCGQVCEEVQADPSARVTIEFGCATVIRPPA